jgi:tRNA(His) 5'-end guanylyltransferase
MIQTSHHLMGAVQPATIYTFSDEITLIFPLLGPKNFEASAQFFQNNQKIASVVSGMASSKFTFELLRLLDPVVDEKVSRCPFAIRSNCVDYGIHFFESTTF